MKLSLLDIVESFFQPEIAKNTKNSAPRQPSQKGPLNFPYQTEPGETLSDREIDQELKLELKLGNIMRDPTNLSNHNAHDGSFSWGKSSKTFGNYQKNGQQPTPSKSDSAVQPFETDNGETLSDEDIDEELNLEAQDPEQEEIYRKHLDKEIIDDSGRTSDELDEQIKKAIENLERSRREAVAARRTKKFPAKKWEEARSPIKPLDEDIGMREKGRAYGNPVVTKQPFASGVPKNTGIELMDEDEIAKELGLFENKFDLLEWISSSAVFNRRLSGPKSDLDFFEKNRPPFAMTTEEEFTNNQRKLVKDGKTKKRKRK